MTEQEYLSKIDRMDSDMKEKFYTLFSEIYPKFTHLKYSQLELFLEHLKRVAKKDSIVLTQLWEKEPNV